MSNTKLSALTAMTTPVGADLAYLVDVSDTTDSADGSSRKVTLTNLFAQANVLNTALVTLTGTETLTNKTLTTPIIASISNSGTITIPTGTLTLATLTGTETLSNKTLTAPKFADGGFIADANGNEMLIFDTTASAVNEITISNAATGNKPAIIMSGDNTNIGLYIAAKGSADIVFGINAGASDRFAFESGGDFDLALAGGTANIQVEGVDPKRGMYVPATAMFPSTTAGCASLTQVESSTNDVNIKVLDFDGAGTSKESAEFGIQSPLWWDASTVTCQFVWYASAGSGTVNWECQGFAFSDDDALDQAYGTLQEVTDTLLATGDVHISAATAAITIGGTPVAGDWVNFRINRDPANDTNTSDARLMGVRIVWTMKQYNDA